MPRSHSAALLIGIFAILMHVCRKAVQYSFSNLFVKFIRAWSTLIHFRCGSTTCICTEMVWRAGLESMPHANDGHIHVECGLW